MDGTQVQLLGPLVFWGELGVWESPGGLGVGDSGAGRRGKLDSWGGEGGRLTWRVGGPA